MMIKQHVLQSDQSAGGKWYVTKGCFFEGLVFKLETLFLLAVNLTVYT